jgi:hypothetical protein
MYIAGVVAAVLLCLGVIAVTVLSDASQTYGFGASRAGNLPLTALFFLKVKTMLIKMLYLICAFSTLVLE